jgi:hypothetical protein
MFTCQNETKRGSQQTGQCVFSIPCEWVRSYIWGTGRLLAVRIREHTYNLKQCLLEKSKLAQHAYEKHGVNWESTSRITKYKETTHLACSTNRISQPSLYIPPILIHLFSEEFNMPEWKSLWTLVAPLFLPVLLRSSVWFPEIARLAKHFPSFYFRF